MIGFFPEPYDDEIFFSICSRYHAQTGYAHAESSLRDLFGNRRVMIPPDIPCYISALLERLPKGHQHTVSQIIDHHTLLPFYAPFEPRPRVLQTRREMAGTRVTGLHGRLAINTLKAKPEYLRYCSPCVAVDRLRYGETYWHRLHQIPGVEVCYVHAAPLRNSAAPLRYSMGRKLLVTAEEAISRSIGDDFPEAGSVLPAQLRIAQDAAWLLTRPANSGYLIGHRERYMALLFERGLSTYNGKLKVRRLTEQVRDYYSAEFLARLQCELPTGPQRSWICELVFACKHTRPPLHHLLLLQFLGVSLDSFLQLPERRLPFGEAPWPCLNRASAHFRENRIWKVKLTCTQRNGRRPRGTFRCSCGFIYSRIGPEATKSERFIIDRYINYGREFEERVQTLLNAGRSLNEIAREVHISPGTLDKLIAKMHSPTLSVDRPAWNKKSVEEMEALRKLYQSRFLAAREEWPDAGRHQLHLRLGRPYDWLYKQDRQWLNNHLPPRKPTHGPADRIDWHQKDIQCASAVHTDAERIRDFPGRPVRVTASLIARNLRIFSVVSKRPEKLPLTMRALRAVAESTDDYRIRRLQWLGQRYREEGVHPDRWELIARAGLNINNQYKKSRFKAVLDDILNQLSEQMRLPVHPGPPPAPFNHSLVAEQDSTNTLAARECT